MFAALYSAVTSWSTAWRHDHLLSVMRAHLSLSSGLILRRIGGAPMTPQRHVLTLQASPLVRTDSCELLARPEAPHLDLQRWNQIDGDAIVRDWRAALKRQHGNVVFFIAYLSVLDEKLPDDPSGTAKHAYRSVEDQCVAIGWRASEQLSVLFGATEDVFCKCCTSWADSKLYYAKVFAVDRIETVTVDTSDGCHDVIPAVGAIASLQTKLGAMSSSVCAAVPFMRTLEDLCMADILASKRLCADTISVLSDMTASSWTESEATAVFQGPKRDSMTIQSPVETALFPGADKFARSISPIVSATTAQPLAATDLMTSSTPSLPSADPSPSRGLTSLIANGAPRGVPIASPAASRDSMLSMTESASSYSLKHHLEAIPQSPVEPHSPLVRFGDDDDIVTPRATASTAAVHSDLNRAGVTGKPQINEEVVVYRATFASTVKGSVTAIAATIPTAQCSVSVLHQPASPAKSGQPTSPTDACVSEVPPPRKLTEPLSVICDMPSTAFQTSLRQNPTPSPALTSVTTDSIGRPPSLSTSVPAPSPRDRERSPASALFDTASIVSVMQDANTTEGVEYIAASVPLPEDDSRSRSGSSSPFPSHSRKASTDAWSVACGTPLAGVFVPRRTASFRAGSVRRSMRRRLCSMAHSGSNAGDAPADAAAPDYKPPNVLIYTGPSSSDSPPSGIAANVSRGTDIPSMDSDATFASVQSVISSMLAADRYAVYRLSCDDFLKAPWPQHCECILMTTTVGLDESRWQRLFDYFNNGGKMLFMCQNQLLLYLKDRKSSRKRFNILKQAFASDVLSRDLEAFLKRLAKKLKHKSVNEKFQVLKPTGEMEYFLSVVRYENTPLLMYMQNGHKRAGALFSDVTIETLLDSQPKVALEALRRLGLEAVNTLANATPRANTNDAGPTPGYVFFADPLNEEQVKVVLGDNRKIVARCLTLEFLDSAAAHPAAASDCYLPIYPATTLPSPLRYFDHTAYFRHLTGRVLGKIVIYVPTLQSTMRVFDRLPQVLDPDKLNVVCIARCQTQGRGRGEQNRWLSPPGCAMFSLPLLMQLRSTGPQVALGFLQHIVGLAVVEGITSLPGYEQLPLSLKWPNDVYWSDRTKLGGVVVTSVLQGTSIYCTVGVGINVANSRPTTCINDLLPCSLEPLRPEVVIAVTLSKLEELFNLFVAQGPDAVLPRYYDRWLHRRQIVTVTSDVAGKTQRACVEGVDASGYLLVRTENGAVFSVQPDGNSFDMLHNLIRMKI